MEGEEGRGALTGYNSTQVWLRCCHRCVLVYWATAGGGEAVEGVGERGRSMLPGEH